MKNLKDCPECLHDSYQLVANEGVVRCRRCGTVYSVMSLLSKEDTEELRRRPEVHIDIQIVDRNCTMASSVHVVSLDSLEAFLRVLDSLPTYIPIVPIAVTNWRKMLQFDDAGRCILCGGLAGGDIKHSCGGGLVEKPVGK